MSTASQAMTALERASVILAVIQAALTVAQAISNVLKSIFNRNDKRIEKSIENHRKAVEDLEQAYSQLERVVNRAIGTKAYEAQKQQIANLEQQRRAIENMRRLELEKKKTDKDKVREFDSEIQNINNSIEDLKASISEALLGTNFRDFSNSLVDAVVGAFEAGESAIDAMNDTFDNFIKNALTKSLLLNKIAPIIEGMMDKAAKYAEANNGSLVGFDFDVYRKQVEATTQLGLAQLDTALAGMGIDLKKPEKPGDAAPSGIKGAFERTVTESTANEWIGLGRASYEIQRRLLEITQDAGNKHLLLMNQSLAELNGIRVNTGRTAENTDVLHDIAISIEAIARNTKPSQNDRDLKI